MTFAEMGRSMLRSYKVELHRPRRRALGPAPHRVHAFQAGS